MRLYAGLGHDNCIAKTLLEQVHFPESITITGEVPDPRPYIAQSSVYIAPLRVGGGTRFKLMEAMAMRKPIVTTTLGCEGFAVQSGGGVTITSEEGQGTRVKLYLSACPDCVVHPSESRADVLQEAPPPLKRILVVEDQPEVRAHVEKLLGRLVICCANLAPRKMKFGLSEGMVLAASDSDGKSPGLFLLSPDSGAQPGMRVK